jgi:acyl-CoA thioester hydrolase
MERLDHGVLAATHEELALHVDLAARRSGPLPPEVLAAVEALEAAQAQLPPPPDLGRVIAP